jgi:hypothetical protein
MIRLIKESKLTPSDVIEWSMAFFGPGGWAGLEVIDRADCCAHIEGGGGHVTATICLEGDKTRIDLVTKEWDYQVKKFVSNLP